MAIGIPYLKTHLKHAKAQGKTCWLYAGLGSAGGRRGVLEIVVAYAHICLHKFQAKFQGRCLCALELSRRLT